ncbi:putative EF-TU receptor [Heracleum sosnowskyi]|uniref:EF-TU receptor n=1 Tax=Heracleum sosnowskyi TaxID=360622 RepID=A0AAD8HDB5_9APIA|nr:putative EF-TU receptor [Heracleum sosnowskyi]
MVAAIAKEWLSEIANRKTTKPIHVQCSKYLGILSFETAKTMSRLVALYKSLSQIEINKLKDNAVKSKGVTYLNSADESFLFSLACAERLEDLDCTAVAIARLGQKCNDLGFNRFDILYADLKLGTIEFEKLEYGSRKVEKKIKEIERLVYATVNLHASLEGLSELELSERKMEQWKNYSELGTKNQKVNSDHFHQKLASQRKQVLYLKKVSLWNKTFDQSVETLARITCIVYARICKVFGPYIPDLPACGLVEPIKNVMGSRSGPILGASQHCLVRFHSQKSILSLDVDGSHKEGSNNNRVFHAAGPNTVGGSGLAVRYANVILLAERYLGSNMTIGRDAREDLYEMLPQSLRKSMRSKLSKNVKKGPGTDELMAGGWKEALNEMMEWLAPMAHDTLKWQMERNFERMKFESKPTVLLLQTLHFSDKEKAEAAIAEVLVGLSCIYWCENRQ